MAVGLSLWTTRGQTFFSDEWHRLTFYNSDSLETLLRGYNGYLVVGHVLLYKALFGLFGADSYLPFRIVEALLLATCGLLFYALARSRAGPWPCLLATLPLLFLGSAYEVTATPYGTVVLLPVALGLAALVCLERFRGNGDPLACLLLLAAVASQSIGLAFVVGAAVVLAQQSGRGMLARSWVVLVPGLLYATWFTWYHLTASSANPEQVHLHNLGQVPSTVVAVCAAGLSGLSGFFGSSGFGGGVPFNLDAGYLLLGLLVIGVIWRVRSGWKVGREIWVPIALGLTFWALAGMVASVARPPESSRYIYPSAVFLLLIGLELVRGLRLTSPVILVTAGAIAVSLIANLVNLVNQGDQIRDLAISERDELGALELVRKEVPTASISDLVIHTGVLGLGGRGNRIPAADYFAAVDRYGSPAASPEEIAAADETQRQAADRVLLRVGDLTLTALPPGHASRARNCRPAFGPSVGFGRLFGVPASGLEIQPERSRSDMTVVAHRFATGFQTLSVPPGSGPMVLRPGAGQEVRPWLVRISGATVCALGPAPT
jgi:hypothetical protein